MTTIETEISVVMPCLNEEQTVGICIQKAWSALEELGTSGEVVISDNGSTDGSVTSAEALGARVVHQRRRGYGNALLKGIAEARGEYIVMGDADDTYDWSDLGPFIEPLRNGYDLVMGNRFSGEILPGAMPWHHQYIGNPILSGLLNLFFRTGVRDAHCGIRSFRRDAVEKMQLTAGGMEFASEMVINAAKAGLRITEVPIKYYPRPAGSEAKLRSLRDGWRHLRFMLLYAPDWTFLVPGFLAVAIGFTLMLALVWGPIQVGRLYFGIHYIVLGCLLALLGTQIISLGLYAKAYADVGRFGKPDPLLSRLKKVFRLERGILLGGAVSLVGLAINAVILVRWLASGFGELQAVEEAIVAMTLMVIGVQIIFSSFFLSILGIRTRTARGYRP
jgi:glycosyltransferase involved in cell wall biosynthesis